jgi:hypothetical protein
MKNLNILEEANTIIHGARNKSYGHPAKNHGLTSQYWQVYLKNRPNPADPLSAIDVCFLNILQKISRSQNGVDPTRDTLTDIAGYAGNVEMIQDFLVDSQKKHYNKAKGKTNAKTN